MELTFAREPCLSPARVCPYRLTHVTLEVRKHIEGLLLARTNLVISYRGMHISPFPKMDNSDRSFRANGLKMFTRWTPKVNVRKHLSKISFVGS